MIERTLALQIIKSLKFRRFKLIILRDEISHVCARIISDRGRKAFHCRASRRDESISKSRMDDEILLQLEMNEGRGIS